MTEYNPMTYKSMACLYRLDVLHLKNKGHSTGKGLEKGNKDEQE